MLRKRYFLFIFLLLSGTALSDLDKPVSDGPYVFESENQREAISICSDKKLSKVIDYHTAQQVEQCKQSVVLQSKTPSKKNLLNYQGNFQVAAVSDIHGQFDLFIELLRNNKIIDENNEWSFANGHFVITGDIFDRGEKVTETLWFIYQLEQQARKAGGQVHLLLGNHEVMVLNGDLRYLNPKYVKVGKLLDKPFETLFSPNSVLGAWLRSLPVLVKVNHVLFAHGGFHPDLVEQKLSLSRINQVFTENLVKTELEKPRSELANYLHTTNGPIWYRGYFYKNGANEADIDSLLQHFGVQHIVVGHTSQKRIETRYDGKVIAIDASMKLGQYGEVLLIQKGQLFRGTLQGVKVPLIPTKTPIISPRK
ncbi:metallophosphoesterase [Aliikangiella sp. IMCC44359]|uniref:metallophosphoesterase n=1 Tax=Aliikangiella sp. IMCC44359 TaxID=3459125 RepID=UPI00403AF606